MDFTPGCQDAGLFPDGLIGCGVIDSAWIPLAGSGRSFSLALIDHIVEATAGYPYFLHFFGAFACSRIGLASLTRGRCLTLPSSHDPAIAFVQDA